MKKINLIFLVLVAFAAFSATAQEKRSITLYDGVVFYNGYDKYVGESEYKGIVRLANHLYTMKLSNEQLDWSGDKLKMKVYVDALCDDYDRIGCVALALVEKGAEKYDINTTPRMEIGRFITPFMDKNVEPTRVPYAFDIYNVAFILHDKALREKYDFWLEFELFGISGSAEQWIRGCKDRKDVFAGTIEWETEGNPMALRSDVLNVPIVMKRVETDDRKNFNNYTEGACDTLGICTKTWRFNLEKDLGESMLTLISSNHGANEDGEEYNRRLHLVYFDGELVSTYVPGEQSCEPYRVYNTCPNGIYGYYPMSDERWQSFSNWCPGAIIPIRHFVFNEVKAGDHEIMIRVPDARFADKQGDFPISMFFQGAISGSSIAKPVLDGGEPEITFVRDGDNLVAFTGSHPIMEVQVISYEGRMIRKQRGESCYISLADLAPGTYIVALYTADGLLQTTRFVK